MYKNNIQELEAQRNLNCEIKRYDLINYLIKKNKFLNYLEIGVFHGDNIRLIKAPHKDGVDPGYEGVVAPEVTYPITSDDFFELIKGHDIKYDIIFIDGLHHKEQVDKDIKNSLNHLVPNGYILLHDCNPISYEAQKVPRETVVWNGDVWESIVNLRLNRSDLEVKVVDTDFGVGIVNFGKVTPYNKSKDITWEYFQENKKELINLITVEEFKQIY